MEVVFQYFDDLLELKTKPAPQARQDWFQTGRSSGKNYRICHSEIGG